MEENKRGKQREETQSLQPSKNMLEEEGRRSEPTVRRLRPTPNEKSRITLFSADDIKRATNGLSDFYKVGQGAYGVLYRGYFDYTEVFIKMLDAESCKDVAEFLPKFLHITDFLNNWQEKYEVVYRGQMRRPKLVKLIGVSIELPSLVYEFLPNGSVEDCLQKNPSLLTWQTSTNTWQTSIGIIRQVLSTPTFLHDWEPYAISIVRHTPGVMLRESWEWRMGMDDSNAGDWDFHLSELGSNFGFERWRENRMRKPGHMEKITEVLRNLLCYIDFILNKKTILCSDYKDSKSIMIETCGTTSEEEEEEEEEVNILSRTSSVRVFSYSDIERATNGFSKSSRIGQGGYGTVYKGYLDNTEVAIKMLNTGGKQGQEEFIRELDVLGQMQHPNLVKLIGACFTHHSLVYEFMPNGSLEDFLKKSPRLLTWQMRTRIVYEICLALIFLHSNKPQSLIHGDLKPANILLDANFNIKLADFGLCRFLPEGTNTRKFHQTRNIGGTEWYIDPDFLEAGKLSPRCDVYSFGVTILRILTGKSPAGIVIRVREAYKGKSLTNIGDYTAGPWPDDVAEYLVFIGLRCCDPRRGSSALMMEILSGLKNILDKIGL